MYRFIPIKGSAAAGWTVFVAAALCLGTGDVAAKGKYLCKPALTGWGTDDFQVKAKRKAREDFLAKASAAYGKILHANLIDLSCRKLRGQQGWKCKHKARPCISGGLKPSKTKKPFAKPPRYRMKARPKSERRGMAPKRSLRGGFPSNPRQRF